MQQTGRNWLGRTEAHAVFGVAWHAAAAMLPDEPPKVPSERQVDNLLASGLPVTKLESGRRKFERGSVQRIAQLHAESDGRCREIHVTEHGPWMDLWRLHRVYSDRGVVVLMNLAHGEVLTGYPRRTLQHLLEGGELPCSMVGNSYFVPRKSLEGYVRVRGSSSQGGSGTAQLPVESFLVGTVTSHRAGLIFTPLQGRDGLP